MVDHDMLMACLLDILFWGIIVTCNPNRQRLAAAPSEFIASSQRFLKPLILRVQVPYRLLKAFHKVQQRLVRELEKKFSGKDVVLIANRRVMPTPSSGKSIARPRSRTLTAVRPVGCVVKSHRA
jgi:hypothetical protein